MVSFVTSDPLREQHDVHVSTLRRGLDATPKTTHQPMNGNEAVNRVMSEMENRLRRIQADPDLRREVTEQCVDEAQILRNAAAEAQEQSRLFVVAGMITDFNRHLTSLLPENDPATL